MQIFIIRELAGASDDEIAQINASIRYYLDWFQGTAKPASCSVGFVIELAWHSVKGHYNVHAILDEIAILEGRSERKSQTKRAAKFRRPLLAGLWHKHHFQAAFMAENILLEINKPGNLESRLKGFMGPAMGEVAGQLAIEIVDGSLRNRAKGSRLTGEFIVFERDSKRGNHYLTLGSHGRDEDILKRIEFYRSLDRDAGIAERNYKNGCR